MIKFHLRWKLLIILMATLPLSMLYGQITPDEEEALTELIQENVEITANLCRNKNLDEVYKATFYKVKRVPHYKSTGEYSEKLLIKTDSGYVELTWANDLLPVIHPDFTLTSQNEAQKFEKTLDYLFPVFTSSEKQIVQRENTWIFVRSESWGEKEGTIVTINDAGKILNIESNQKITLP